MSNLLFDRKYSLLIGPRFSGRANDPNGIMISGLRVAFKCEKSIESNPNVISIDVYNLSKESRSLLEENAVKDLETGVTKIWSAKTNPPTIIFNAGYGENVKNLFVGDTARIVTKRVGADIITTIEAGDGEDAFARSRLDKSFSPGATLGDVLGAVKNAMGLDKGQEKGINLNDQFLNGVTLSGSNRDHLNMIARRQKLEWSIQNGQLQFLPIGVGTDEEVILLNSETGLIGTPQKTKIVNKGLVKGADGKEAESGVQCLALLNPDIKPGRRIKIESEFITGVFRVQKVNHQGDTHANPWYSEIEAV